MSANPKISIVLPTYNGAKYLRQSIDSCLNQTFRDLELIVIDDSSTDDTPHIIKSYDDPRIRYFRNEQNQRLPKSLNIGFAQAKGDFLTWTSDDNFFAPQALEKMAEALDSQKVDFVYCDYYSFHEGDVQNAQAVRLDDPDGLKVKNCVMGCFMYTRRVLESLGDYDTAMELVEDYDYWIRVWKRFSMQHIKEPLYYYQYHSQSLTGKRNKEIDIIFYVFQLKHGFLTVRDLDWVFSHKWFKRFDVLGPALSKPVSVFIYEKFYKKGLNNIFRDLEQGKISFNKAREGVYRFLHGR